MEMAVAHAHLARAIHELGDEKESEYRGAKCLDAILRHDDYLRAFDRVLDAVLVEHEKSRRLSHQTVCVTIDFKKCQELIQAGIAG